MIVYPKLKRLMTTEGEDLASYRPQDLQHFVVSVQAFFGLSQANAEESFQFTVCSPSWIADKVKQVAIFNGRHHLIIVQWNYESILKYVNDYAMHCSGRHWSEVAGKLSRLGHWEFEDYKKKGR